MEQPVDLGSKGAPLLPLVGRQEELQELVAALCHRRSRLILGPAGAGKTRLLHESLGRSAQPCVYVPRPVVLHQLLVALADQLGCGSKRFRHSREATSMTLKPLVLDALRRTPRCVVLEDMAGADPRMYRFLQQIYYLADSCLIVTARSRESLGHVRKLLWDPREEIALPALSRPEARRLFEQAARTFRIDTLNLEDFRRKVLSAANGNPGQIVAMCRLAARAEYRSGPRIKFPPLRIDVLSCFL